MKHVRHFIIQHNGISESTAQKILLSDMRQNDMQCLLCGTAFKHASQHLMLQSVMTNVHVWTERLSGCIYQVIALLSKTFSTYPLPRSKVQFKVLWHSDGTYKKLPCEHSHQCWALAFPPLKWTGRLIFHSKAACTLRFSGLDRKKYCGNFAYNQIYTYLGRNPTKLNSYFWINILKIAL